MANTPGKLQDTRPTRTKLSVCLYNSDEQSKKEIKKTISRTKVSKRIKHLEIDLTKQCWKSRDPQTERWALCAELKPHYWSNHLLGKLEESLLKTGRLCAERWPYCPHWHLVSRWPYCPHWHLVSRWLYFPHWHSFDTIPVCISANHAFKLWPMCDILFNIMIKLNINYTSTNSKVFNEIYLTPWK